MNHRAHRIVRPATAFSKDPQRRSRRPRVTADQHLRWIRTLPCLVSGVRRGVEAAHVRYADSRFAKRGVGLGERPDDKWTVPLSAEEHRTNADAQHKSGEREWWTDRCIDPVQIAAALWGASGDDEAAEQILREAREGAKR